MTATLKRADAEKGYFMTDSSTWVAEKKNVANLTILFRGDKFLVNTYHTLSQPAGATPGAATAAKFIRRADDGSVAYGENNVTLQPDMALRRRIILVLPRIGVFNTTVFRNVVYALKVRGLPQTEIEAQVNKTLAFVGLDRKKTQHTPFRAARPSVLA
jgi:ABC-type proline/glycine betaine transport system ATPase subunit